MKTRTKLHPITKAFLGWMAFLTWVAGIILPGVIFKHDPATEYTVLPWVGALIFIALPVALAFILVGIKGCANWLRKQNKKAGGFYLWKKEVQPVIDDIRVAEHPCTNACSDGCGHVQGGHE